MSHLCYVYINEYKCLKDIEVVVDCHYNYSFDKDNRELTITKNDAFPKNFWGKNIYSITGLVGNNGSGKSSVMSFLLGFLAEGSACDSVNGVVVYEQKGEFYYYGKDISVIYKGNQGKSYDTSIKGGKDSILEIPCFYYSGHFSPFINNDSRNSYHSRSMIASDNVLLVKDLQNSYEEDLLKTELPLITLFNNHVAQNNSRICMMLANKKLSGVINNFAWPRYVIVNINKNGATSIESEIKKENQKRREFELHNEIFRGYYDNAVIYSDLGKYVDALECYDKALKECNRIFGEDSPEAANIYNNKAAVYNSMGDNKEAERFNKKALDVWKKYFGAENTSIAETYNNIGTLYKNQGDYDNALKYYKKALEIREKDLGVENLTTAASYNNIGLAYTAKGNYDKALGYYNKALKIWEESLGIDHQNTAQSYNNIGNIYEYRGEYDKALEYYYKALEISKKVLGHEHLDTATLFNNIGSVYDDKGDYSKALDYYLKALAIREKVLGMEHPDTAASYNNIGVMYYYNGDYDKALEYFKKALMIVELKLGKNHPSTARTYNNIGLVYYDKGDYDKALEFYQKALVIKEKILGMEHPDTATSYNNIGAVYHDKGDYDKALEYYQNALMIVENNLGPEHPNTAASYNNFGTVYNDKGDYDKALEFLKKALEIIEKVLGTEHPSTATSYNNIGLLYNDKGDYDKALEYHNKALTIREKVYGKEHPDTAISYYNIAQAYVDKGEYDNALRFIHKAYIIFEKVLGSSHPDTESALSMIKDIQSIMRKECSSKGTISKQELIGEKACGTEQSETIRTGNNISLINKEKKDFTIAYNDQYVQNAELSIPIFNRVFEPSTKDNFISLLIYHSLLNLINDKWGWKDGFDIVIDWQGKLNNTIPLMDQFNSYVNGITDKEKKEKLMSLEKMLLEMQNHTVYKNDSRSEGFLYVDCEKDTDNLVNLGERVLSRNEINSTSKFFDFSYAQTLDSETILSSGEQELLNLFSRLYDSVILRPAKFPDNQPPCILMLDEAEIGFHPDWQRRYLKLVIDFINALKTIRTDNQDFQIIISTHSPILLSDIPKCCTNYFERTNNLTTNVNKEEIGETFAANVFNLYRMSFFMKDGLVGEFARTRIKELDKRIDSGEIEGVLNEIRMIGDDGIREYLLDNYQKKHPIDKQVKKDVIRYYQEKINQLKKRKK